MQKNKFISVLSIILTILVIGNIDISGAGNAAGNVLTATHKAINLGRWVFTKDNEPKETLKNIPDSLWQNFAPALDDNRYTEGNWLLKTEIVIDSSVSNVAVWGLFLKYFITAYEIYWDGIRIAQNGILGINKDDEKAGLYNFNLSLPPHMATVGAHTIILRISNYNNISSWKWFYGDIVIGPYDVMLKKIFQSGYQSYFIAGILIIPFIFNLFLYFARKRKTEHLLFSLICFFLISDYVTYQIPALINPLTTYAHWEVYLYKIITLSSSILFPAFFVYMFSFPKKYIGLSTAITILIFIFFANDLNMYDVMSLTVLVLCSILSLWALITRRQGSINIFIGILLAWVGFHFNFAATGLATIMVLCTNISIATQFAKKEKTEKEAQLRTANLENELLKKNINPHFLLNTLTSIIVWLRRDPKSAISLIEALADEFRMVMQISPLKQITIQQEIDLCNAHLKIMSYRKGAEYKLETIDIDENENIPPMIFHTLIENGLTHGYENKLEANFTLQRKKNENNLQYILTNDGDFTPEVTKNSTGFGLKYIKSRLDESYPERWNCRSQKVENGWETVIEIKDK